MSDACEEELIQRGKANSEADMVIAKLPPVTRGNFHEITIPRGPYPLIEEAAARLFFNDFVIDQSVLGSAFYTNLPGLLVKASANSAISNIVSAVGLATFSYAKRAPNLVQRASQMYSAALHSVNVAMANPITMLSDETLAVVLLMTFYEENGSSPLAMDAMTKHIMGSLALLDARGPSVLQTHLGRQLMRTVRIQVVGNCLSRKVPVPNNLLYMSRLARQYETSEEISDGEMTDIYAELCVLQADLFNGKKDSAALLAHAMTIDADMNGWAAKCPTRCCWKAIGVKGPCDDVLGNHWDLYRDVGVAFVWNNHRTIRILVNEIIIEQLSRLIEHLPTPYFQPPLEDQISYSRRMIDRLARKICTSVPFFLGRKEAPNDSSYDRVPQPQLAVHGRALIWPLYVAGSTCRASDSMRQWIVGRLENIAEKMAIPKAGIVAQALRSNQQTKWLGTKDLIGWRKLDTAGR